MKALVLRFDGPLMSFGSVIVDQHGFIDRFPGTSMLTGLLANALGWRHGDVDQLNALQMRLIHASRWDITPQHIVDYHTVDLGHPKMRQPGWTTRGAPEHRDGGEAAKYGTHQRYRHYWADGLMTVALGLRGEDASPTLEDVHQALLRPARPLFLGRKTCLPARPLLDPVTPVMEGPDILSILRHVPVWERDGTPDDNPATKMASWPDDLPYDGRSQIREVYDMRDWANQVVTGPTRRYEGKIGRADA